MPVAPASASTLPCTPEILARTSHLFDKIRTVVLEEEWPLFAPEIDAILRLKQEKNAIILAHNYQTPEIFHCVADIVGDSLALARKAAESKADIIVMAGVHFMAETAKLVNPGKKVLMPDMAAGCSLAESITAEDIRKLREQHPGAPVVTYVNTSAEVKAEADICCTSGNALEVVRSLNVPKVIFLPDEYLAAYVDSQTDVEIVKWPGRCEVHERFSGEEITEFREGFDNLVVIAHPECGPDVLDASDFVGSTAQMIDFVRKERPARVLMVTECSMSDNVAVEVPDVEFVRPCNLCPHMKLISLTKIREALETAGPEVTIDPDIAGQARASVEKMLAI